MRPRSHDGHWLTRQQGQFFPFFIVTVAGLVTLPVTYSLLKPSKGARCLSSSPPRLELKLTPLCPCLELENTAPRIQSSYSPDHADLIQGQRRRQRRRERKIKRMFVAIAGWATMAFMVYLMAVTTRTQPQIWDPYEILGIPMVRIRMPFLVRPCPSSLSADHTHTLSAVGHGEADPVPL